MKDHYTRSTFPDGSKKHYYNGSHVPSHFSLGKEVADIGAPILAVGIMGTLAAGAIEGVKYITQDHPAHKQPAHERPAPKQSLPESHIGNRVSQPSHEKVVAILANARPVHGVGPNGPMIEQFGGHPSQPTNQIK